MPESVTAAERLAGLPTATALVAALARRDIGALELCDATIAHIEEVDGPLNAVVVRDFERARGQARAADAALARGERRPLLGLPMTVKESFNVAGLPTTWGFPHAKAFAVGEDALLVSRLKAAGAVILGKTNVALGLGDWQSINPVYGRTLNPLDATRTPGGSSGGAAAALASGLVALELGSDIGGSIRVPAHFCGVWGHKPSLDLLPQRGHQFPGVPAGAADPLSVSGPLARSGEDLELALSVLAGPDADDATAWQLALPPPRHTTVKGCRVLVLTEHPAARTSREVQSAVRAAAERLVRAGALVQDSHALLPDLAAEYRDYLAMLIAIVTRGAPGETTQLTAHDWLALMDRQARARTRWRALFAAVDVVLAPVFGTVAYPHDDTEDHDQRRLMIDGEPTPYTPQLAWPGVASFAGLPATAAPIGRSAEGLPIGAQFIGPPWEDRTPLAIAKAFAGL